jgi:hypothetical protein
MMGEGSDWLFGPPPKVGFDLSDVVSRPSHVPFVVSFGGGANSTAVLLLLQREGLRPDLITFADTGGEKPETYAYLDRMNAWCEQAGFPTITPVRLSKPVAGDLTLEAERLRLEQLPSKVVGNSQCSLRWKLEPQEKFIRAWAPAIACYAAGEKPIRAIGYDAGEPHRVSIHEDRWCRYVHPLIEHGLDRDGCEALIRLSGLQVPMKSACFYCPSSRKSEVLWLSEAHPDLFARAVAMERKAMAGGKLHSVKGLGRHWSWEALVRATPEDRDLFSEQPVEPCVTCDDGGCDV